MPAFGLHASFKPLGLHDCLTSICVFDLRLDMSLIILHPIAIGSLVNQSSKVVGTMGLQVLGGKIGQLKLPSVTTIRKCPSQRVGSSPWDSREVNSCWDCNPSVILVLSTLEFFEPSELIPSKHCWGELFIYTPLASNIKCHC